MRIHVERFNITSLLGELAAASQPGQPLPSPAVFIKRDTISKAKLGWGSPDAIAIDGGITEWRVLQQPLSASITSSQWTTVSTASAIRVPLFSYNLVSTDPELLVVFGAEIGAIIRELVPHVAIRRLCIAVGNLYQRPDGKPGYQAWIGVALELENADRDGNLR